MIRRKNQMAFLVSPGIQVKEIDMTNVIPATSSSTGAIAGRFQWGPAEEIVNIGSEKQLVNIFGQSTENTFNTFLSAAQFLSYGNSLKVVRSVDSTTMNAVSNQGSGAGENSVRQIKNDSDFENASFTSAVTTVTTETLLIDAVDMVVGTEYTIVTSTDDAEYATYGADNNTVGTTFTYTLSGVSPIDSTTNSGTVSYVVTTTNTTDGDIDSSNMFIARYPGALGNSLKVEVCTPKSFSTWGHSSLFNTAPGTSSVAELNGAADDEVHIVVIDEDGLITGNKGSILETFSYLSQSVDGKNADGSNNYYRDVVNNQSIWVRVTSIKDNNTNNFKYSDMAFADMPNESVDGNNMTSFDLVAEAAKIVSLSGGTDGTTLSLGDLQTGGFELFRDTESVDISLLMNGESLQTELDAQDMANYLITLAEERKDVVAFVSPNVNATAFTNSPLAGVKAWRDGINPSSYAFADSGALYVYDKYNDKYRWIAASGSMAGLAANADNVADAWFSPAGFNRGTIRNVTKLAYNPNQMDRDTLYKLGVNPLVSFPGQGTILYGDKTLQTKASAFDRINVRRLFILLEKAIAKASKASLFEFNDEFTRAQFRNMVEPFLRDIKGRRGVTDFMVVCDDTNNTGDIVDTNRFVADIYIKPARSINFITLNFIATRTGVEFSEIAGGN